MQTLIAETRAGDRMYFQDGSYRWESRADRTAREAAERQAEQTAYKARIQAEEQARVDAIRDNPRAGIHRFKDIWEAAPKGQRVAATLQSLRNVADGYDLVVGYGPVLVSDPDPRRHVTEEDLLSSPMAQCSKAQWDTYGDGRDVTLIDAAGNHLRITAYRRPGCWCCPDYVPIASHTRVVCDECLSKARARSCETGEQVILAGRTTTSKGPYYNSDLQWSGDAIQIAPDGSLTYGTVSGAVGTALSPDEMGTRLYHCGGKFRPR